MTLYKLKPAFQNILRPVVIFLHKMKVSPNAVTLFTCLASCFYAYVMSQHKMLLIYLPVFFFVRMAFNAIDGMLAKEFDQQTPLGAILNEVTDVISDTALYLALAPYLAGLLPSLILFCFLSLLTEYAGVTTLSIGSSRRYDGPLGKSDRAFFISALGLLLSFSELAEQSYFYLLVAANILLLITFFNRVKKGLSEVKTSSLSKHP